MPMNQLARAIGGLKIMSFERADRLEWDLAAKSNVQA